jgi:uncharacterized protein (DUF3084 family)
MTTLATLDATTIGAVGVMIVGIISAVVAPVLNRRKTAAQTKSIAVTTESIATRTTLEVNEDLRKEVRDLRDRAAAEIANRDDRIAQLEAQVAARDERIGALETRVATLRQDVDTLEAEIVALRRAGE